MTFQEAELSDRSNSKTSSVGVRRDSKSADVGKGVKRSDSLTKDEKTESNTKAREREMRQTGTNNGQKASKKFVQRSGESGLKRRHTVGGTRDFDKVIFQLAFFNFFSCSLFSNFPFRFDTIRLKRCGSAGWLTKVMRETSFRLHAGRPGTVSSH